MTTALVIAALVAIACVIVVGLPFIREPATRDDRLDAPGELERRRLAVAEERDRALVGPLRRRVADSLRALDGRTDATRTRVHTHG